MTKQFAYSSGAGGEIVLPALKAVVRTSPWLKLIPSEKVVYRESRDDKVKLIAGGGSGHSYSHENFVGTGLLDAAVSGNIFASPSTKQISAGLTVIQPKETSSSKGTLIIVKNYTGDVIHFGLAAERAKAKGLQVELVVVGDDVSVGRTQGGLVGRRGLAGTVLVHKIAGAAAESGLDLPQVAQVARAVINNTVTVGASLEHCSVPGRQFETNLKSDEIDIGMGIHNEPGVRKLSPIPTIEELVTELLPMLLSKDDKERSFVNFNNSSNGDDDVILLMNNLGGISNLELFYATEVAVEQLREKYGIIPRRIASGTYMTAMNGPGFSITLLNARNATKDAQGYSILDLFDAPANAVGWNTSALTSDWESFSKSFNLEQPAPEDSEASHKGLKTSPVSADPEVFAKYLLLGIKSVLKAEPNITEYDTVAGDGDCGETLAAGGHAILDAIKDGSIRLNDGVNSIADIADIVEDSMGGTSGGLYSIFLSALAKGVLESHESDLNVNTFAKSTRYALDRLYLYTKARVGDRTLIDALAPFVGALEAGKTFADAVSAAVAGANSTRKLEAKFGRASYVSREELKNFDNEGGLPDPGAMGLAALLEGFAEAAKK